MPKDKDRELNEPDNTYKKAVRIFSSFSEAEAYELEQIAKQDPIQRIHETVELILRVYGFSREELNQRTPDNRIKLILYK